MNLFLLLEESDPRARRTTADGETLQKDDAEQSY